MPATSDADYWKQAASVPSSLTLPPLFLRQVRPDGRVLDVGCGTAAIAPDIRRAGGRYTGVDLNMASLARASGEAAVAAGSGERLPFRSRAFSVVFLRAVLTVLVGHDLRLAVLQEAVRVCRGVVAIQDFLQAWEVPLYADRYKQGIRMGATPGTFPVLEQGRLLYWARHYTRDELEDLTGAAGATITAWEQGPASTRSGNVIQGFGLLATRC